MERPFLRAGTDALRKSRSLFGVGAGIGIDNDPLPRAFLAQVVWFDSDTDSDSNQNRRRCVCRGSLE